MTEQNPQNEMQDAVNMRDAAQAELDALLQESTELPDLLQEAMSQRVRAKIQAARKKEDVRAATASADLDITQLRERHEDLPFEIYQARIEVEKNEAEIHRVRVRELYQKDDAYAERLAAANKALEEAQVEQGSANTAYEALQRSIMRAETQASEAEGRAEALELAGVDTTPIGGQVSPMERAQRTRNLRRPIRDE